MAVYTNGGKLEWREVESGELPSARSGLRATLLGGILFVTGGNDALNYLPSILAWDPVAESWQAAGNLTVGRYQHAAVAVPDSTIAVPNYCYSQLFPTWEPTSQSYPNDQEV